MAEHGLGKLTIIGGVIAIIMLAIIFIPAIISPSAIASDLEKYENGTANSSVKAVEGTSKLSIMMYSAGLPTIMTVLGLFALVFIIYFAAKRLMRWKK